MATGQDLIEAALREIGVLASSETANPADITDGLARLNRWIDFLATQGLTMYQVIRQTSNITAGFSVYTVGSGGNLNIERPPSADFIQNIHFVNNAGDPDAEYPLTRLTGDQWANVSMKLLESTYPQAWYYNPEFPLGKLYLWPLATAPSLNMAVYYLVPVSQIATAATTVSLPPAYAEMITQNLALLLCPSYERQPHPVLVKSAAESMAAVKRANHRAMNLSFGADVIGDRRRYGPGGWNIRTGT